MYRSRPVLWEAHSNTAQRTKSSFGTRRRSAFPRSHPTINYRKSEFYDPATVIVAVRILNAALFESEASIVCHGQYLA